MNIKRIAYVIDNEDPDKKDRLKLRIIPEMIDIDEKDLPWVLPESGSGISDSIIRIIPEKESTIFVKLTDDFMVRNMRYSYNCTVEDNIDYDTISDNLDKIDDLVSDYQYPQPNIYNYYPDGSFTVRNTETGEFAFYHSSGVYTVYDEDGNIKHYLKDKAFQVYNDKLDLQLKDNGDLTFENEKVTAEMLNDGNINFENGTCKINMSTSSVKINENFEVFT